MHERFTSIALALLAAGWAAALLSAQPVPVSQAGSVSFANDVEPILERSCRSCHGDTAPMGRLDLSTRESLLRGGTRGTDLVPGNARGQPVVSPRRRPGAAGDAGERRTAHGKGSRRAEAMD
jgi:Planctomycete cytochrome C.